MDSSCSITTKHLHTIILISWERYNEELLYGLLEPFKCLLLWALKPKLDMSPFIFMWRNYIEDSYYDNFLFYPIILSTAFSVLTGHKNTKVIMCPSIILQLNREVGLNHPLSIWMINITNFSLPFLFLTRNSILEIVLLIFFQTVFFFTLVLWMLKST